MSRATAAVAGDPTAVMVCRVLNDQGVLALDHLRLWGHVNDLLASGVGRRLKAETSLYMTATAHAHMAFVYLRKLLDGRRDTISLHYLLKVIDKDMPALTSVMAARDHELQWGETHLRQALNTHRKVLADLVHRAEPALTVVNELIVHMNHGHVRDPIGTETRLERSRISHETFVSYFRCAEWIVNGWDLACRGEQVHWAVAVNRDDFGPIRDALTLAAGGR